MENLNHDDHRGENGDLQETHVIRIDDKIIDLPDKDKEIGEDKENRTTEIPKINLF